MLIASQKSQLSISFKTFQIHVTVSIASSHAIDSHLLYSLLGTQGSIVIRNEQQERDKRAHKKKMNIIFVRHFCHFFLNHIFKAVIR